MPKDTVATELKHMFNAPFYRNLSAQLSALSPKFDPKRFLHLALDGHDERALMSRMRQTAVAAQAALPGSFVEQLSVLRELAPKLSGGFVTIFLSEFVTQFGEKHFDDAMDALKFFTRFGSAEFAVRPFLARDQTRVLAIMRRWADDESEDVRRLASEGCRPRLPWGLRLQSLVKDPSPLAPILERLKDDPSLYVRKSVANNLNDIAKDHPEWVLVRLESWDLSSPRTAWIARHAARTLIKRGNPRALALFGVKAVTGITADLTIRPRRIRLGEAVEFNANLQSKARQSQRLVVDYVVHYVKANGAASAKVFKWTEITLGQGESISLKKRQVIRDFTTRRHYAGKHRVELQVNGKRLAEDSFALS